MKETLMGWGWRFWVVLLVLRWLAACVADFQRDARIHALEHDSVKFYRILYGPLDGGR